MRVWRSYMASISDGLLRQEVPLLQQSTYSRIASALTVIEVAEPIRWRFEVGTPLKIVCEQMEEGEGRSCIVLITDNGSPRGFLESSGYFEPDEMDSTIEQKAQPIDIWRVVSAQTSLFDLIPLWERSYFYFVLDGAHLSHFVARHDMDKAPVKAALFALTAELEERMMQHLLADQKQVTARFQRLSPDQQKRARKLSIKKNLPDLPYAHIQNTYFSDKVEMFIGAPELASLLPFATESEARGFLDFIGKLRNEMAHGGSIFNVIRDASQLKNIIDLTEDVISRLRN
jgi:hypothetical protein